MSYNTLTDCELADLLNEGDEEAFNHIYKRFWKKIYNETYKRLKDTEIAGDIVQDVFADLWIKRHSRKIENLNAYLITAARYQVFMQYKKASVKSFFEQPLELLNHPSLFADSIQEVKELKDCINEWMSLQPEKRREVFRLKFIEDKSTREISEVLNISQKTVQNQFTISLHSLRSTLSKLLLFF
ncbi:RNA polymerase sigma factor [Mucilaginibacter gotjawali]|uniref:ECF RNA polymerase sigma factor SigW n=2 Tax=Mucilaginibacter gotjawali TaxID=1550579 RepID=A0A0X8X366_9SPHI|nr:sigma-70 family RNA polymerase sigma factor [Mucilaginibacter gotjawali]MBB3058182.1 RNA polymerase sigma-70 factor (ECF subfamily) [Mucilaginibacter gotjawali]BAU54862.1 ECF RNA polymerase sigma factor SigW [Mucilaginibacter gotjawali]